jgi:hypothetical protein
VSSKLLEPTVSSLVNANVDIEGIAEIKGTKVTAFVSSEYIAPVPKHRPPKPIPAPVELTEEQIAANKAAAKEAAQKIRDRAARDLAKVLEKRGEEEKKQKAKEEKDKKMLKHAR